MAKRKYELPNGRAFDTDGELQAYMEGQKDAAKNVVSLLSDGLRESAQSYVESDAKIYSGMIDANKAKAKAEKEAAKKK